jgi:hypothetical protein
MRSGTLKQNPVIMVESEITMEWQLTRFLTINLPSAKKVQSPQPLSTPTSLRSRAILPSCRVFRPLLSVVFHRSQATGLAPSLASNTSGRRKALTLPVLNPASAYITDLPILLGIGNAFVSAVLEKPENKWGHHPLKTRKYSRQSQYFGNFCSTGRQIQLHPSAP